MGKILNRGICLGILFFLSVGLASAISIDADYITIYPGEQGKVSIEIDNNENFDIEEISVSITLANLPFSSIGSSEKSIDEIDEDDDDRVGFTIKASTDIKPGDYSIPYTIKYTNSDTEDDLKKEGSFGIRISSKTDLDFDVQAKGAEITSPLVGKEGRITLEVINRGLGEVKSVSVEITPEGFELLSSEKAFIGTINGDDTDSATFSVIYKSTTPTLNAKITYKDFDNNDQVQELTLPFKVYGEKEALDLGIIKKSKSGLYITIIIILLIIWIIWRKIRKSRKNNKGR
jgi:hypothetical protein